MAFFLSRFQAERILKAFAAGRQSLEVSLDLGVTESAVTFEGGSAVLPGPETVSLKSLEAMLGEQACFMLDGGGLNKMQFYLPETRRTYRLLATGLKTAPTAEVGGFRMHRTKGTDPMRDTASNINAVKPIRGSRLLDTCTGLGYTALAAVGAGAAEVHTVEVDGGMRRLRELNPWSSGFTDSRIREVRGDVAAEILGFEDGFFGAAIHDPPSVSAAGGLYSLEFYRQLRRVLDERGRLFHYVGAPGGRYRGKKILSGVMMRLREAGFRLVVKKPKESGVLAVK